MIQAIKDSKWYWHIPIVGLFFISFTFINKIVWHS